MQLKRRGKGWSATAVIDAQVKVWIVSLRYTDAVPSGWSVAAPALIPAPFLPNTPQLTEAQIMQACVSHNLCRLADAYRSRRRAMQA